MATKTSPDPSSRVRGIVEDLIAAIRQEAEAAAEQKIIERITGVTGKRTAAKVVKAQAVVKSTKPRKKAPKQLCPVPGCKNVAAPAFGMVCAKHKGVPKAKIKKYREARRQAKLKPKRA